MKAMMSQASIIQKPAWIPKRWTKAPPTAQKMPHPTAPQTRCRP